MMKTVVVELRNSNALRLLKDLELANVIRVLDLDQKSDKQKLSATLRGAISKERANELKDQVTQIRDGWEGRNI